MGLGNTSPSTTYRETSIKEVLNSSNMKKVFAGFYSSLFLHKNGTVYGCGNNEDGMLGLSYASSYETTLQQVKGINNIGFIAGIDDIASGYYHSLFLTSNSIVYGCGRNTNGQLGIGTTASPKLNLVQVQNTPNIIQIVAAINSSLFLANNNIVYGCGNNIYGQLGTSTNPQLNTAQAQNASNITQISTGGNHSLFLQSAPINYIGGGGGGGQLKYYTNSAVSWKAGNAIKFTTGTYNINVGTGGILATTGTSGGSTTIKDITNTNIATTGGGGAGGTAGTGLSAPGGGGGGSSGATYAGGVSTGTGGRGGSGSTSFAGGGGGGLSTANGSNATATASGAGAPGVAINLTGTSQTYAAGGTVTSNVIINTGSGGGTSNGSDGIVILKYNVAPQPMQIIIYPTITLNSIKQTPITISEQDRTYYYVFNNENANYEIKFDYPTICDVLLIGGGGGGARVGGGGGAGACILSVDYMFQTGTYNIVVGKGGNGSSSGSGENGLDSSIGSLFIAKGGGGGGASRSNGLSGGCGGGAGGDAPGETYGGGVLINTVSGLKTAALGFGGGYAFRNQRAAGGGGGISAPGEDFSTGKGGNGNYSVSISGNQYIFKNHFSPNSTFGVADPNNLTNFYIGGGGGGGGYKTGGTTIASGGLGGGGNGYLNDATLTIGINGGNAINNTGSGGGGSSVGATTYGVGGNGGSGLVIIRFKAPVIPITYTSNIQLQRWQESSPYYNNPSKSISYQEGNIGISTNSPLANLHVGVGTASTTQNMVYFNRNTIPSSNNLNLQNICATFDSSILVTGTIASSSDNRIKTDVQDVSDDSALKSLMSIQPKTYNYIDQQRSSNVVYGFIAQQIKEVIPEAVTQQADVVPNIYSYADCHKNIITFSNDINVENIGINDKIDVYDMQNQLDTYSIISRDTSANSISLNKNINSEQVFVYGTRVDDFNTLNKSYIYTLNVCATQNLSQKITQLQSKLGALEQRFKQ